MNGSPSISESASLISSSTTISPRQFQKTKIARGDASTPQARDSGWHLNFEKTLNAERDETILPIARAIGSARGADCARRRVMP